MRKETVMKSFQLSFVALFSAFAVAMDSQHHEKGAFKEQARDIESVTCTMSPDRSFIAHNQKASNEIQLQSVEYKTESTFAAEDTIKYLVFSPDSKKLLALSVAGDIAVYATSEQKLVKKNKLKPYHWHGCFSKPRFNKDGTQVAGKCADAFVWDLENNEIREIECPGDVSKTAPATFNSKLSKLAYMVDRLEIRILDAHTLKPLTNILVDKDPKSTLLVSDFEFYRNKILIKHNNGVRVCNEAGDILFDKQFESPKVLFSYYPKKSLLALAHDKTVTIYKVPKKTEQPENKKFERAFTAATEVQAIDYNGTDIAVRTKLQASDNKQQVTDVLTVMKLT